MQVTLYQLYTLLQKSKKSRCHAVAEAMVLRSIRFTVPKCRVQSVPMHHVLFVWLCKNRLRISRDGTVSGKEEEMSKTKKLVTIVKGDRKLMGMLSGIVIDMTALVAILVTACIWYLP